jgi:hypothetical protein
MKLLRFAPLFAALLPLGAGCVGKPDAVAIEIPPINLEPVKPVSAMTRGAVVGSTRDAAAATQTVFNVDMYLITVPAGTISSNEDFWKRVDEKCVDVPTADLLYKNGLRVGQASLTELTFLASFLDGLTPIHNFSMTGAEAKDQQMDMKKGLDYQSIFLFDKSNRLVGNDFFKSDNIINFSFGPAPRKPGQLQLTVCPMVRSLVTRIQYTAANNVQEYSFVHPEKLYDLNLRTDLPPENFFIISPSPDSYISLSVGNAFFQEDAPAQKMEKILLVISRPLTTNKAAR